jgi:pimeloyl-ACP methyl ester carboxylesterase
MLAVRTPLQDALLGQLASRAHPDLHLIDGASHWPQADQPEAVARILKNESAR